MRPGSYSTISPPLACLVPPGALALYRRPTDWKSVQQRAMRHPSGWRDAADQYLHCIARSQPDRRRYRRLDRNDRTEILNPPMDLSQFAHQYDHLSRDVAAFRRAISNKLMYQVGKNPESARPEDWLHAVSYAVRDHLVERWMKTIRASYAQDVKRVYYLSMEFLIGRSFSNALLALDLMPTVRQALTELEVDPDIVIDLEPDAALGNGGLGRLAACFLDSMATLGVPGFGYGIRYDYGMFRQQIIEGQQVEVPDYWLAHGNPWEFHRPEICFRVRYGGHLEQEGDVIRWVGTDDVLANAYDTIILGYGTEVTNTLRLWSAKATEEIDLSAFNQGNYFGAVESKNHSRTSAACCIRTIPPCQAASCVCVRSTSSSRPACRTSCAAIW